jgi:hypothetical protein
VILYDIKEVIKVNTTEPDEIFADNKVENLVNESLCNLFIIFQNIRER